MALGTQLIVRVAIIIFLIWVFIFLSYFWNKEDSFSSYLSSQSDNQVKYTINNIKKEQQRLLSLSQRVIEYQVRNSVDPLKGISNYRTGLQNFWELVKTETPNIQIIYTTEDGRPEILLNMLKAPVDNINAVDNVAQESFDISDTGDFLFSCQEACYISFSFSAMPYNMSAQGGYILLRYPLDDLIWRLKNDGRLDIAILEGEKRYSFSPEVKTEFSSGFINNSTDNFFFNEVMSNFDIKDDGYGISLLGDGRYILVNKIVLTDELTFLIASDITHNVKQKEKDVFSIVVISMLIIFITGLLIHYALKPIIKTLKIFGEILPLVAKGKLDQVKKMLELIPDSAHSQEVILLQKSLQVATKEAEALQKGLADSIEDISGQLSFVQEIVNSSRAIFVIFDDASNIQLCNLHAAKEVNLSEQDLLHSNFFEIFQIPEEMENSISLGQEVQFRTFQSNLVVNDEKKLISWSKNRYVDDFHKRVLNICVGVDITERLVLEERITYVANHDELTGLINRRKLNELLLEAISINESFYFLYIDLNYFKVINDSLGHAAGDQLLISFSRILENTILDEGIAARTGGDEFTVLLFLSEEGVKNICQSLIDQCKKINDFGDDNKFVSAKVGLSIGIVNFPRQAANETELHAYADAAMYENKVERNSSYHFYTGKEVLIRKNHDVKFWVDALEDRIENSELVPYFQSIHSTENDFSPIYFEVLCRFFDGDELVEADEYIRFISDKPIMAKVDIYMIRASIKKAKASAIDHKLMINVSAYTLSLPQISEAILRVIFEENYPPSNIVFEITEQSAIKDIDRTIDFMKQLQTFEVGFALDDFGTGFSSLSYLQRLPIQFLKIDKAFVKAIQHEESSVDFLHNIIRLVKAINVQVIIEGIESSGQALLMKKLDADYLQGYFFSKPKEDPDQLSYNFRIYSAIQSHSIRVGSSIV